MQNNLSVAQQKEMIRRRIQAKVDENKYFYYPETIRTDHYKSDEYQRVAVYVRVSTDDVNQTTSFELQRKYYEDFVREHDKWELVRIFADEGISGTSLRHRDAFNEMISMAKAGKIDLIITKSVSRFARNVEDFLSSVRTLAEHNPPVGVYFQTEAIYSLQSDSSMALTVQATMAENESRNKSRSMETSLRMRLDHGLPLTPKLLGFTHDENGKLIADPESCRIPKLMFYMCLFGYSSQQIADKLTALRKKTYLGNAKWTASGVVATLRNERYCGDVFTRKTFTRDVLSHRSIKNRGERPRSRYLDEHEAIVSRDDFMAVQMLLNNHKYRNRNILPELQFIPDGLLKGYVIVNPRWGSFSGEDYLKASAMAYDGAEDEAAEVTVKADEGDFDFSGYEIAQLDIVGGRTSPLVSIENGSMVFSRDCLKKMPGVRDVQLLVHPSRHSLAVRPAPAGDRQAIRWLRVSEDGDLPRIIPTAAFSGTLFSLFGWNPEHRYRLGGSLMKNGKEEAMLFTSANATVMIRKNELSGTAVSDEAVTPLTARGKRISAVAGKMDRAFGKDFYEEQTAADLVRQTAENWQIRLDGQLCDSGQRLKITPYEELKAFIQEELGELFWEDDIDGPEPA